jgi:hypothetical protein
LKEIPERRLHTDFAPDCEITIMMIMVTWRWDMKLHVVAPTYTYTKFWHPEAQKPLAW